jgi:hypothetical protein
LAISFGSLREQLVYSLSLFLCGTSFLFKSIFSTHKIPFELFHCLLSLLDLFKPLFLSILLSVFLSNDLVFNPFIEDLLISFLICLFPSRTQVFEYTIDHHLDYIDSQNRHERENEIVSQDELLIKVTNVCEKEQVIGD